MNKTVILYSTGCPRCVVLKRKLDMAGVDYTLVTDFDEMVKIGLRNAPALSVDGELLDFSKAIEWTKRQMP